MHEDACRIGVLDAGRDCLVMGDWLFGNWLSGDSLVGESAVSLSEIVLLSKVVPLPEVVALSEVEVSVDALSGEAPQSRDAQQ